MKKILIIRNDKVGDFMLTYPALSLLKTSLPDVKISVLVSEYTSEMAKACKDIDEIIIDPGASAGWAEQYHLLKTLRNKNFDAAITLFSTFRVGMVLLLAGISYRLSPATKIAQIFYNHKLVQRRSKSLKPEYEYNLDIAIKYLSDIGIEVNEKPKAPFLQFSGNELSTIQSDFYNKYHINKNNKLIFIHPGTGGSATNINLEQYAKLIKNINVDNNTTFVITAGPNEIEHANNLSKLLKETAHIVYHSVDGLINFSKLIQLCDLFISASTGPLHIAGALDRPTAAFYQRRRSATPLRWQTLNSKDRRLAFTPPETAGESDMQQVDITEAAATINNTFLKTN